MTIRFRNLTYALICLLLNINTSLMFGQDAMEKLRNEMVKNQLEKRGISNQHLLGAMKTIPRHLFIPESQRHLAYADRAVPIGYQQTISQPFVVALCIEHLNLEKFSKVLEVGTGSGYVAAVLAFMIDSIYTIEIVPELSVRASKLLSKLNLNNIEVLTGDGYNGYAKQAPYDAIIVSAASSSIPKPLMDQLKVGGHMIIPIGQTKEVQRLKLIEKQKHGIKEKVIERVRFVPLTRKKDE